MMIRPLVRIILRSFFLVAWLSLPVMLHGQALNARSSIVGQALSRVSPPPSIPYTTFDCASGVGAEVYLIADGDTLWTDFKSSGVFSFDEINCKQVTLSFAYNGKSLAEKDERFQNTYFQVFYGTIELMPGENILYIPFEAFNGSSFKSENDSVFTTEGDTWVYHYPDGRTKELVIERLLGIPGVEYNKKKKTISISGQAVRKSRVGDAYLFCPVSEELQ